MTGLDSNFEGPSKYSNFSFLEGPEEYDGLIQRRSEYRGSGVGVLFEDEVYIDEYTTYRGIGDFWTIELEDRIGVSYADRLQHDCILFSFFDGSSVVITEPHLREATSDDIKHVAQFVREFDMDHNARVIWHVDDERRVRIGVREFLSRTLSDYDPYLDERYR